MILTLILYLTYTTWGLFLLYLIYYYVRLVSKVSLVYHATEINKQIIKGCSLLRGNYWPSIFVFNSHLQGVILMKLRKKRDPKYRREIIIAEDGATLELDWGESEGKELKDDSPILCLLSGVTGNSGSSYIVYLMTAARQNGWRPVIMNYPNATGSPMTSPRFFCIDSVSDTKQYIDHVHNLYPNAPMVGAGFSLGGHFFIKYLQEVPDSPLLGAVTLSAPFNSSKCTSHWKGKWVHDNVYDKHFLEKFQGGFKRNAEVFKRLPELNHEEILAAKNMFELHTRLSTKLYKVKTIEEYYYLNSSDVNIHKISKPLLVLHAWNDPVVPPEAIPVEAISKNEHIIFAATKTGGHTGWLSGLKPFSTLAWCEKVVLQYAKHLFALNEAGILKLQK